MGELDEPESSESNWQVPSLWTVPLSVVTVPVTPSLDVSSSV
ncbi:hypothetical protein [Streptomyces acidiscabies]|nr:hypothetical protein [Streptomyces acidiscabies]